MSSTMDLIIRPTDVLIFRDGRPFSAGDDHRASGIFPPPPSSFYGALRSAGFSANGIALHKEALDRTSGIVRTELGTASELGSLTIAHFTLSHAPHGGAAEPLYALPADVLQFKSKALAPSQDCPTPEEENKRTHWRRSSPDSDENELGSVQPRANWPLPSLRFLWQRHSEQEWYAHTPRFLTQTGLERYLLGEKKPLLFELPQYPFKSTPLDCFRPEVFEHEPRTSLEITKASKTAEDGKLFEVDFVRPGFDIAFAVRLTQASSLKDVNCLRLGGESRVASVEQTTFASASETVNTSILNTINADKRCLLVLSTPAVFLHGWRPDFVDADGSANLDGCKMRLVGAALGRPLTIGGWDIVKNRPREARRAVPAGSVYYFELMEAMDDDVYRRHTGSSFSRAENDRKLGLGIAFFGCWPRDPEEHPPTQ